MSTYYNHSQPVTPQNQAGSQFSSPTGTPRQQSPLIDSRKQRRHYAQVTDPSLLSSPQPHLQRYPTPPSFQQQPNAPQFRQPSPNNVYPGAAYNNQMLNNAMGNMSVQSPPPPPPPPAMTRDVSLVGQPPLIEDLKHQVPMPRIPLNITATSSQFAQVDPNFKHATVNVIPYSNSLVKKAKVPLALILQPYLSASAEKTEVPVVNDTVVARCTRCKTYINPFVQFTGGAMQWRCNMCGVDNDVPQAFDWDIVNQQQSDRYSRLELNYGCVDFVAPAEYTVRPPQPPVYAFVIDTSYQAVQSGMIAIVADAIKASLDKLPNEDGRTKIAFITVDSAIGFYKLAAQEPELLVVGDLDDIYLPRSSSDLIVNLLEYRKSVDDLLDRMKTMHNNSHNPSNCLGSALQAARKLLSPTGGKIVCFQGSVPNVGEGALKPKQDGNKSLLDSPLMSASNPFYKNFAGECTKSQVCADMFIFGSSNSDVATLNVIPRFTGGQTHYFHDFKAENQAESFRLKQEVIALLSEEIGLEAVMRTRCSPGIICKSFYGNCTTRVPDIMALPNVPRDQSYCIELAIEEDIQSSHAYFQTALLYTTCFGERRIRVMNLCLPVTKSISELYASTNQIAIARTLCHQAIDLGVNKKLREGRDYLSKQISELCTAYRKEIMGAAASTSQLTLCRELCLLPLLLLGILKSDAFSDSPVVHPDVRANSTLLLRTLPEEPWLNFVHPHFWSLHNMPQMAGTIDPNTKKCIMPPTMNLSSEKLEPHGCYLVENGHEILLWIGKNAVPLLCKDLLGVSSVQEIQSGQVPLLPRLKTPLSERITTMISHLESERQVTYYPTIYIIKEDAAELRSRFLNHLVEDRQPTGPTAAGANQQSPSSGMSYFQWLGYIRSKSQ